MGHERRRRWAAAGKSLPILFALCDLSEAMRAKRVQSRDVSAISECPTRKEHPVGNDARQQSAKIYQFPQRGSANGSALSRGSAPAPDIRSQRAPAIMTASGWYHEAAIEAERTRKQ
jgi:hypothetical protein